MGIFKRNAKQQIKRLKEQFELINGYSPVFTTYSGGLYEMELIRSCVEQIAIQCSKLNPVVIAPKHAKYRVNKIEKILKIKPNRIQTTQQFLAKLITILKCENNAFIIPLYSNYSADEIVGLYPVKSKGTEIRKYDGIEYLLYYVDSEQYAIEYERVGHLRLHYYEHERFGSSNLALSPTLNLIDTQNQGIINGIKNSAAIRFLAKLSNVLLDEDMRKERKRLKEENLSSDNNGGVMIFDAKYSQVQPIDSKPFIVDSEQTKQIKENVFDYFHVCEEIIQNKANEDQWNAFYEGCIEPISTQLSQVLTSMFFTKEEIHEGCGIYLESSKLQFASNNTKLQVSQQLFDRGLVTVNYVMRIWNLPEIPDEEGGNKRYIRKEYTEVQNLDKDIGGDSNGTKSTNGSTNENKGDSA